MSQQGKDFEKEAEEHIKWMQSLISDVNPTKSNSQQTVDYKSEVDQYIASIQQQPGNRDLMSMEPSPLTRTDRKSVV